MAPIVEEEAEWPAMSLARVDELLTAPGSPFEIEERVIRGVPLKTWKAAPATLRDVWEMGRSHAGRTFLVYEDERATFDAFMRATVALAWQLQRDGVQKGDRVAILMRNLPEWPVAFFAAILAGGIATPLNAWWTGAELEYGLRDCGAKVAILDGERAGRLADYLANCTTIERVYVSRPKTDLAELGDPRAVSLQGVIGATNEWHRLADGPAPDVALDPEDDATIFYTSGTTGSPKGALGTHRAGVSAMYISGYSMARSFLRRGEAPPAPDPDAPQRRGLLSIPFFHVTGCIALLCTSVYSRSMIAMMRKWDPEGAFALIEREKLTLAGGVPTIAWQLLEHPSRHDYDLSSLNNITYGGAPAAPELVRRMKEVFPHAEPSTGWGMTETSATFTHHYGRDYENRPGSCGPPPPIGELRIVGSQGETLPCGAVGELWARGPNVVKGYWRKPEATAATFEDGWVKTGDLARLDEEGFCYIVDRAKDMIIRGGENIYCTEVEAVLFQHPAVMDAALVPVPHRQLGEEPAAVVALIPNQSASEEELRAWVASHMAAFNVPVKVVFWPEPLPRNANGKILKTELKKLFLPDAGAGLEP